MGKWGVGNLGSKQTLNHLTPKAGGIKGVAMSGDIAVAGDGVGNLKAWVVQTGQEKKTRRCLE